jgi:hypothetical protein
MKSDDLRMHPDRPVRLAERDPHATRSRGRIAIFNRSYYEEVVVVRVHPDLLAREAAAPATNLWRERFEDINAFERHLARNGTVILKFFLHISKKEQRKRLLARLDDPHKTWKFSVNDIHERRYWDDYQTAYEEMLNATNTPLGAVVRRSGRPQVVRPRGDRERHRDDARVIAPALPVPDGCGGRPTRAVQATTRVGVGSARAAWIARNDAMTPQPVNSARPALTIVKARVAASGPPGAASAM